MGLVLGRSYRDDLSRRKESISFAADACQELCGFRGYARKRVCRAVGDEPAYQTRGAASRERERPTHFNYGTGICGVNHSGEANGRIAEEGWGDDFGELQARITPAILMELRNDVEALPGSMPAQSTMCRR